MIATRLAGALSFSVALALPAPAAVSPVTFIPGSETAAAFAKGRPLLETAAYQVHASRRDAPGQAEVHTRDTDIMYVLEGTATIVTGGRAVDARETAPYELRGASIAKGTAQRLAKGDVFVVPHGVPHQFTEVHGPLLYYVVKVTAHDADGG
jgi:mannose-6-phosphate isomerase-like protein (cupin superfamily)